MGTITGSYTSYFFPPFLFSVAGKHLPVSFRGWRSLARAQQILSAAPWNIAAEMGPFSPSLSTYLPEITTGSDSQFNIFSANNEMNWSNRKETQLVL